MRPRIPFVNMHEEGGSEWNCLYAKFIWECFNIVWISPNYWWSLMEPGFHPDGVSPVRATVGSMGRLAWLVFYKFVFGTSFPMASCRTSSCHHERKFNLESFFLTLGYKFSCSWCPVCAEPEWHYWPKNLSKSQYLPFQMMREFITPRSKYLLGHCEMKDGHEAALFLCLVKSLHPGMSLLCDMLNILCVMNLFLPAP